MKSAAKLVLMLFAFSIAAFALFALQSPNIQSPVFESLVKTIPWAGYLHIIFGSLALILGGFQLSSRLRRWNLSLHKAIGNTYVACVLISTIGALVSLPFSNTTWPAASAFWTLAIAWPAVTIAGYPRGGKFEFQWHGKLMIYSYSLTCAAISLRILLGGLMMSGVSFHIAYPISAWGGFLINVAIAVTVLQLVGRKRIRPSQPQTIA